MTARLTADAVDAVLRSSASSDDKVSELLGMVALARRLDAPPNLTRDARNWPILTPASGVIPLPASRVEKYDPRD